MGACTVLMLCLDGPGATAGGIDHKVTFDDSGIGTATSNKRLVRLYRRCARGRCRKAAKRLGRTFWQAVILRLPGL
jgi:hypothetical protein